MRSELPPVNRFDRPGPMLETARVLRTVAAIEPMWVKMVRLGVGAAVVLLLTVSAVRVNELIDPATTTAAAQGS